MCLSNRCVLLVTAPKVVREGNVFSRVCLFTAVVSIWALPVKPLVPPRTCSTCSIVDTLPSPLALTSASPHPSIHMRMRLSGQPTRPVQTCFLRTFWFWSWSPRSSSVPSPDLLKFVHYIVYTFIGKREVGLRLKGLLVIFIFYTFTDESFTLITKDTTNTLLKQYPSNTRAR